MSVETSKCKILHDYMLIQFIKIIILNHMVLFSEIKISNHNFCLKSKKKKMNSE